MKIVNLTKSFNDRVVLNDITLDIEEGKILGIMGKSGSGKTTLLNIFAGVLTDFQGEIKDFNGDVSFIFQNNRLIPNLTVQDNLKLICPNANVEELLKSVDMENDGKLYPKQLSGGMARRVAILRAFAYKSNLMLLDEPFRNLDIALKLKLQDLFKKLWNKDKHTAIIVSHDIDEIFSLCDRVVILDGGKIVFDKLINDTNVEEIKNTLLQNC